MRIVTCAILGSVLAACAADGKRPNGSTCDSADQCAEGLCVEGLCLDPQADGDHDGLLNGIEAALGTNPESADSDGDGIDDATEVGAPSAPRDFDGDGIIDALDSDAADHDGDCLVDQRDPNNADPTHDPAVLGELGCCCEGHCDPGATAACVDGALVCQSPERDRDHDGIPDACDTPALVVDADAATIACTTACSGIAAHCQGLPESDRATCVGECTAAAKYEGMWIANFEALALTCDAGLLGAGASFGEASDCTSACADIARCGATDPVPVGSAEGCRAVCSGLLQGDPTRATPDAKRVSCVVGLAVPQACSAADLSPCFDEDRACDALCARLGADADGTCPEGAPLRAVWADAAACQKDCKARSGSGRYALLGCVSVSGCARPAAACLTSPSAVPPELCVDLCGALANVCAANTSFYASICAAECAGLAQAVPAILPPAPAATACVGAEASCPPYAEQLPNVLARCTVGPPPDCGALCTRMQACGFDQAGDCLPACTYLAYRQPERLAAVKACIDGVDSGNCQATKDCTHGLDLRLCEPACLREGHCGGNASLETCASDCQKVLDTLTPTGIGLYGCEALANADPTGAVCEPACGGASGVDTACEAACAGRDACVEAGYGLCPEACHGALVALGVGTDAACVVSHLGRACDVLATAACRPTPR